MLLYYRHEEENNLHTLGIALVMYKGTQGVVIRWEATRLSSDHPTMNQIDHIRITKNSEGQS